ncbi:hypothetical protein T08_5301 [Trichinella sp. T8]|nr:hypothetical protein T08_5301 [Trichinella sp. T8]
MMANKQLRKMIICEIFRFLFFAELSSSFDYCSVHVSTVISHVSQQFRFMVFFIVTIHHTSLIVRVAIIAFADTLVLQIFSESNYVEIYMNEIVDKYVITKHYHQLMPLSLATYFKIFHLSLVLDCITNYVNSVKCKSKHGSRLWPMGNAWGYASGNFSKISKFFEI